MINQYILDGIWILRGSTIKGIMIYLIILGILYLTNKRRIFKIKQTMLESILTIYMITILNITGIIGMKFYFSDVMNGMYNMNLIPFKDVSIMMVFLNFLLFVPYGILLPCVFDKLRFSGKKVLLIGFVTSFSIELLQVFGGRYAEADDLLVNSLGAFVGFVIYSYGRKIMFRNYKFIKGCDSSV